MRVPTSDPHTINACWCLFLSFAYLLVAEAASFDKKELCRSDTSVQFGQRSSSVSILNTVLPHAFVVLPLIVIGNL